MNHDIHMATFGWQLIVLLFAHPMAIFCRDGFVVIMLLFFHYISVIYHQAIHNHSYLPLQVTLAADCCLVICSVCCSYFKKIWREFCWPHCKSFQIYFVVYSFCGKKYIVKKCTATVICHGGLQFANHKDITSTTLNRNTMMFLYIQGPLVV